MERLDDTLKIIIYECINKKGYKIYFIEIEIYCNSIYWQICKTLLLSISFSRVLELSLFYCYIEYFFYSIHILL